MRPDSPPASACLRAPWVTYFLVSLFVCKNVDAQDQEFKMSGNDRLRDTTPPVLRPADSQGRFCNASRVRAKVTPTRVSDTF